MTATLLPLFLRLAGKKVLVVGAGSVAERKIQDLVATHAEVHVVALATSPVVAALARESKVTLAIRAFEDADVDGAWLVIAATSDPAVQRAVCTRADRDRIPSIAIDDPPNGTAFSGSVIRRGNYTIAISSSGEVPALTRLLREVLEQAIPDADWVQAARDLRDRWRSQGTPMTSRFGELVRAFKERAG